MLIRLSEQEVGVLNIVNVGYDSTKAITTASTKLLIDVVFQEPYRNCAMS
jgi:hypothetical protein